MNLKLDIFTPEGKKYCRWIFKIHTATQRAPRWMQRFLKWPLGMMISVCYTIILTEGAQEDARRKTEMSRV